MLHIHPLYQDKIVGLELKVGDLLKILYIRQRNILNILNYIKLKSLLDKPGHF